jgi:tRNA threonylcarbamoyladenosine biosynthesis protein TsaE
MNELIIKSHLESISDIPPAMLDFAGDQKVFLFYGDMGAGKTTLIKAICEYLGVTEPATSPTFSIVNEYRGRDSKLFHFDFYRLKNETEALDLGYEEYFDSGNYCFIEWPEKIAGLLPEHFIKVEIRVQTHNSRDITLSKS